jgi:hypothetical protein
MLQSPEARAPLTTRRNSIQFGHRVQLSFLRFPVFFMATFAEQIIAVTRQFAGADPHSAASPTPFDPNQYLAADMRSN